MPEAMCNSPQFQEFCWWGPPSTAGAPPPTTGNYTANGNYTQGPNEGDEAQQIFDKFDRNHDGTITWKEVKRTLRRAFKAKTEEYHRKFDEVDAKFGTKDGKITKQELEEALRHHD